MYEIPFLDLPALESIDGTIEIPGSKSISNRALLLAALCDQPTTISGLLHSEDTAVMLDALWKLGCQASGEGSTLTVAGELLTHLSQQRDEAVQIHLANAGTAMRPLTAVLALGARGPLTLDGTARMHERPIGDLVDTLRPLGCRIVYLQNDGFPPLRIEPPQIQFKGPLRVRGDVSSQFLSALLMALPLLAAHGPDVNIEVQGPLISKPYVLLTLAVMKRFGIDARHDLGLQHFCIPAGSSYVSPGQFTVEPDASSASYLIAAGALAGGLNGRPGVILDGLDKTSIQGDVAFAEAAQAMGADITWKDGSITARRGKWPLKPIDMDCNAIPDAAMTLAVMALFADGPSTLRNIASWRVKETDRLAAMARELRLAGATVEEGGDFLRIAPPQPWQAASWHTYRDHRMAMCAALTAFNPARLPVRIQDPACVGKTFPEYFETLFDHAQAVPSSIPVICIDGPSASGKGTLASELARLLGYHYLDSGALYRLAGLACRQAGMNPRAATGVQLADVVRTMRCCCHARRYLLGDRDVTQTIRDEAAGLDASAVAAHPEVRAALLDVQRQAVRLPGLVTDGRDMGTRIFPDADLKIFLTASVAKRAQRRQAQLRARGVHATIERLCQDLLARDGQDTTRKASPLEAASDARLLDNSELSIEESIGQVLQWWQDRQVFAGDDPR